MLTFYSEDQRLQNGQSELKDGRLLPCFENPSRADMILARIWEVGLGDVLTPTDFGREPILRVHAPNYVTFLEEFWPRWQALGRDWDALPLIWPVAGFRQVEPENIDGQLGFFSMDAGTPVTEGTWVAVTSSVNVALSAQKAVLAGEKATFALCRPPGHHAMPQAFGGYCFFNNAAIIAQAFLDDGAHRVAVLDVDFHHGNGTQEIFYRRSDVMFLSLHGHPKTEFPFFSGLKDESGEGAGLGFNHNYPLPVGTQADNWFAALNMACLEITRYRPDALVVSLGVDTYRGDPISHFLLGSADFSEIGRKLATLKLPVVFCMEGGYAVEPIGCNVVNVLQGFEE